MQTQTVAHRPPMLPIIACVLSVGAFLGLLTNLAKLALTSSWQPLPFLFWATLLGGILLFAVAHGVKQSPGRTREHLTYYAVSGLFSFAVPNALSFLSIEHVGASFIAFCLAFPPLLTYALALVLRLESFAVLRGLGIFLGLLGALALALGKGQGQDGASLWVAMALAAPLFIAVGNIYRSLRWPKGASPLSLAPGMMIAAALEVGLYGLITGTPVFTIPLTAPALGFIAAQASVLALTYAIFFYLQKLGGPVALSQIGWVGAFVGAAIAVLFLNEAPPPGLGTAMALIVLGIIFVSKPR